MQINMAWGYATPMWEYSYQVPPIQSASHGTEQHSEQIYNLQWKQLLVETPKLDL